jgi:hypothetical protein
MRHWRRFELRPMTSGLRQGDIDMASRHRRHQLTALSGIPDFECQQGVAGQTAPLPVAGIYVEHTVNDRWAGSVHGTPTGRNAIHCGIVARRVHLPKQPCVASGMSEKLPQAEVKRDAISSTTLRYRSVTAG